MKPGTPGFVGERLREAREARGLTATSLSALVGVSRQAISQYENGSVTPGPDVMESMSSVLNLPIAYFLRPAPVSETAPVYYRSISTATSSSRTRGLRRYDWLFEIVDHLRQFVELPTVNLPDVGVPEDPLAIGDDLIEQAATDVRRFWGLGDGPISNVVWLLENQGVIIARDAFGTENIDAFSVLSARDSTPYILLGADKGSAARSRLDVAHELGHIILHRHLSPSLIRHRSHHALLERQAFRFAGAFLLPAESFASNLYVVNLDALRTLKPTWIVSIGAMIKRADDLSLLSPDQVRRLWISYARRGWRKREPLDDEIPVEMPRLLKRAFQMVFDEGIESPADVLGAAVPLAPTDIAELTGLSPYYFAEKQPTVHMLDRRKRQLRSPTTWPGEPGEIMHFPVRDEGQTE